MDLVLKLRELRRLRGLSQKDVERLAGVGEKTLSSFETGERIGSLKISQLRRLLALYGVSEEEFFGRKIEQLFDPDAIQQQSRAETLMAGLDKLQPEMREPLLERFELMLQAAQLAVASHTAIAHPVARSRLHAVV